MLFCVCAQSSRQKRKKKKLKKKTEKKTNRRSQQICAITHLSLLCNLKFLITQHLWFVFLDSSSVRIFKQKITKIAHKNVKKSYETQNDFIMTTTAKQSSSSTDVRGSSPASSNFEAAEDIESIAKQISDHAEAIYQEWKARGLAPTEILKCHPDTDSSFNRTLSPRSSPATTPNSTLSRTILDRTQPISPEILAKAPDLSNSNLSHLVNSFVNEDKARIAAQRCDSPSGSSIKYTLKKFENLGERSPSPVANPTPPPPSYSSNAKSYSSSPPSPPQTQQDIIINKTNSSLNNNNNNNLSYLNQNDQSQQQQHHVPDVLKDTIEKSSKRPKPETPVKPEHLLNHVPTWPLKHRLVAQNKSDMKTPVDKKLITSGQSSSLVDNQSRKSPSIDVMDEVSREEEKLINALKTGTVLTNECLPEVISSLNDYSNHAEQQLNGITSVIKESTARNDIEPIIMTQTQQTPPPQKPNHTPIYVPHKEDTKGFSSFARVSTTRIPSRHDPKSTDDKKFELKSVPSPVRPFLSRGSVAERVLIFEKCPEKTPMRTTTEKPKIQVSWFQFNCLHEANDVHHLMMILWHQLNQIVPLIDFFH